MCCADGIATRLHSSPSPASTHWKPFAAFAGGEYEVPVLEPEALALLSRYEERALHFETTPFMVS